MYATERNSMKILSHKTLDRLCPIECNRCKTIVKNNPQSVGFLVLFPPPPPFYSQQQRKRYTVLYILQLYFYRSPNVSMYGRVFFPSRHFLFALRPCHGFLRVFVKRFANRVHPAESFRSASYSRTRVYCTRPTSRQLFQSNISLGRFTKRNDAQSLVYYRP